jgi:hypothetical protein
MDKQKPKLKRKKENLSSTVKSINRSAIGGSIIGTIIALTPLLFQLHESVPDEPVWNTFFWYL